ncbi:hypothetical protein EVJ58_g8382 [Rhodofomes roseus]|uniref:Dilute domain-containing protein n=1 Tax=Rhodofomes roseus TaxID=34475 RepID=A0A4Y9Y0W8_9APHY|nr:hypothetical protein EVJ58_g8382 [Rhodofomes roseus]
MASVRGADNHFLRRAATPDCPPPSSSLGNTRFTCCGDRSPTVKGSAVSPLSRATPIDVSDLQCTLLPGRPRVPADTRPDIIDPSKQRRGQGDSMASSSVSPVDLAVEPDLQPLYPTPAQIAHLLSPYVGLAPQQKAELVSHCLMRACQFGDMLIMSHLLTDPNAHPFVDLAKKEEDGLGLISTTILSFVAESEREIEREECVRLLVSEGCDVNSADHDGWTPLHYASLLAPATLVSFLLTHGASAFALTRRRLTALDIVTAHTIVPGREDVALILQEAMRGEGWKGGRMEEQRRLIGRRARRMGRRRNVQLDIEKVLGISARWWGDELSDPNFDPEEEDEDEVPDETIYTPPPDYNSMLVFSPMSLPDIFQSLITDFEPSLRNAEPANALYMLARFACINCDHNWLEDLILGACDAIEETFFNRADDATTLIFWLYNTTVWLHLMRCDNAINETLEMLGSFALIEEILNSDFDPAATPPPPSPKDITSFITALHTLLTLSGINPAIIIQLWSQVMYWTACETFNRVLTRKKYICRSRAVQISMNLSVLEEWIGEMQLPRGIGSHFAPVKDLLTWLQSLSSITEFPNLIATIQTLRNLNPLQMRRAVRDYRYEVNEARMTDECNQYLAQLQKDWERHRIKLGVEALRKEIGERERDREEGLSVSPSLHDVPIGDGRQSPVPSQETSAAQRNIDALFDRAWEKSSWEPARAPEPLGELLDSRHMLPLLFPSDPKMLGALPANRTTPEEDKRSSSRLSQDSSASRASFGTRGAMTWRLKTKKLRDVSAITLQFVDGSRAARRWTRPAEIEEEEEWEELPPYPTADAQSPDALRVETHFTPLTRKPSARSRGRGSSAVEEVLTPAAEEDSDQPKPV